MAKKVQSTFAQMTYSIKGPFDLNAAESKAFCDFSMWYDELRRILVEVGTEVCGIAGTSELTVKFLKHVGARSLHEGGVMDAVHEHYFRMPAFPTVWPNTWNVPEVLVELDASLDGGLEFPSHLLRVLAAEVREQANNLTKLADKLEVSALG